MIKEKRKEMGFTQEQMSKILNISLRQYIRIDNEEDLPRRDVLKNLIKELKLSDEEIRGYVASHEWVGCCGYKIEGALAAFVTKMIGSYSGVVGLPLYETRNLLLGVGIK